MQGLHLNALSSLRFIAVFHIFVYHLWLNFQSQAPAPFDRILEGFHWFPPLLQNYFANGWLSTSFFFVLSGFLLAYLYTQPNGKLRISAKIFWLRRLIRIYPIHIVAMAYLIYANFDWHLSQGVARELLINSAIANILLVQTWNPDWVPLWNWPSWALSTVLFFYICAPTVFSRLIPLPPKQALLTILFLWLASLAPFLYASYFLASSDWGTFIGSISSFPPFWLFHFCAGVLLVPIVKQLRNASIPHPLKKFSILSLGDIAFLILLSIAVLGEPSETLKLYLRHGLLLPLYLMVIADFSLGRGFIHKLLEFRGSHFLGDISFSLFIWQAVIIQLCWHTLGNWPWVAPYQLPGAILGGMLLSSASYYGFERPLSRYLRKYYA